MDDITMDLLMERLSTNPLLSNVTKGVLSGHVKDFLDINSVEHEKVTKHVYVNVVDFKVLLPNDMTRNSILNIYVMPPSGEWAHMFADNKVGASLSPGLKREIEYSKSKGISFGGYSIRGNVLYLDYETGVLEIEYEAMRVDKHGFPLLRYSGSLMKALQSWVKLQVYSDLFDSGVVTQSVKASAERDYSWYAGQYVTNEEMLTPDEGQSFVNMREALADTQNRNTGHKHLPQHNTL